MLKEEWMQFLRELAEWQGVASPRDLGSQTQQSENSARQACKRRGWVTFYGGYWRLTDDGRRLLRARS
jgi:Mn-dependent DtxR family transcriptional regulator